MSKQLLAFSLLLVLGCSEKEKTLPKGEPFNKAEVAKIKNADAELQSAIIKAEANNPEGLLKLYEIYVNEPLYGVEFCEVAKEKLDQFLYLKPDLWISTFYKKDLNTFRWKSLSAIQMPPGVEENEFEQRIVEKLGKFRGTKEEMEFVTNLIELINSHSTNVR